MSKKNETCPKCAEPMKRHRPSPGCPYSSMTVHVEVVNRDKPILVHGVNYIATNAHTMQMFDGQGHLLRGIPKANILNFTVRGRY